MRCSNAGAVTRIAGALVSHTTGVPGDRAASYIRTSVAAE
jgi:hypothetical protein